MQGICWCPKAVFGGGGEARQARSGSAGSPWQMARSGHPPSLPIPARARRRCAYGNPHPVAAQAAGREAAAECTARADEGRRPQPARIPPPPRLRPASATRRGTSPASAPHPQPAAAPPPPRPFSFPQPPPLAPPGIPRPDAASRPHRLPLRAGAQEMRPAGARSPGPRPRLRHAQCGREAECRRRPRGGGSAGTGPRPAG